MNHHSSFSPIPTREAAEAFVAEYMAITNAAEHKGLPASGYKITEVGTLNGPTFSVEFFRDAAIDRKAA